MKKKCAWCDADFKNNDLILEYRNNYYCDQDCLTEDIGARSYVFKINESEENNE